MSAGAQTWRQRFRQGLGAVALAVLLLGVTTGAQVALAHRVGGLSPFMLYVAAVLGAGLIHGPLCGTMVLLGGGLLGLTVVLPPNQPGSIPALLIFWMVAGGVLVTANELRVQLSVAMARLSAALERSDRSLGPPR